MTTPLTLGPVFEVILFVSDMEKMLAFYHGTLGLRPEDPAVLDNPAETFWVAFDTGACKLCLHAGGEPAIGKVPQHKVVFLVDDIAKAKVALEERGLPCGEIRNPAPGVEVIDSADPEGNHFALETRQHD